MSITHPKSAARKKGMAPIISSARYSIPDLFNSMRRPMLAGRSGATTSGRARRRPNRRALKALAPSYTSLSA